MRMPRVLLKSIFLVSLLFSLVGCNQYDSADNQLNSNEIIDFEYSKEKLLGIVSIAEVEENIFLACDYKNIYLFEKVNNQYVVTTLENKEDILWNPTGIAYNKTTEQIFIANYNGNNILVFDFDIGLKKIEFTREFTHDVLISPENVALVGNEHFVVANYDGNNISYFNIEDGFIWSKDLFLAHGVSFDGENIYATGLGDKTLNKYDLSGNLIKSVGNTSEEAYEFVWPTAIAIRNNSIAVTDPQRGSISFYDQNLNKVNEIGINSPDKNNFNYPYTSIFISEDKMLVADTFKGRLVVLDEDNKIESFISSPIASSDINTGINIQLFNDDTLYTYEDNIISSIKPIELNPLLNRDDYYVYGFNSVDIVSEKSNKVVAEHELSVDSKKLYSYTGIANHSYLTWIHKYKIEEKNYIVLGSPQSGLLYFYSIDDNLLMFYNSNKLKNLWVYNNTVVSDFSDNVNEFNEKSLEFHNKTRKFNSISGNRLERIYQTLYSDLEYDIFIEKYNALFTNGSAQDIFNACLKNNLKKEQLFKFYAYDYQSYYSEIIELLAVKSLFEPSDEIDFKKINDSFIKIEESGSMSGYGIDNALYNNGSQYASFGGEEQSFTLYFDEDKEISNISISWYLESDIGVNYNIYGILSDKEMESLVAERTNNVKWILYSIDSDKKYSGIKFVFNSGIGQNRMILESFDVYSRDSNLSSNKQLINHNFDLLDIHYKDLEQINVEVSKSIEYGKSFDYEHELQKGHNLYNILLDNFKRGHCGDFAYLFTSFLDGKLNYKIFDIRASTGAIHSVVEVEVDSDKYVFDPTLGISYGYSFKELIDNPYKSETGYNDDRFMLYQGSKFFGNIISYDEYTSNISREMNRVKSTNKIDNEKHEVLLKTSDIRKIYLESDDEIETAIRVIAYNEIDEAIYDQLHTVVNSELIVLGNIIQASKLVLYSTKDISNISVY